MANCTICYEPYDSLGRCFCCPICRVNMKTCNCRTRVKGKVVTKTLSNNDAGKGAIKYLQWFEDNVRKPDRKRIEKYLRATVFKPFMDKHKKEL